LLFNQLVLKPQVHRAIRLFSTYFPHIFHIFPIFYEPGHSVAIPAFLYYFSAFSMVHFEKVPDSHKVGPPKAVPRGIHIIPCPFQSLKMVFNTFVICACLGIAWLVNIKIMCCWLSHGKTDNGAKIFRCTKRKIKICVQAKDKAYVAENKHKEYTKQDS
jgi:hypothetical protein